MDELKTLYWTHGRAKRGIISLLKDGILISHSDSGIKIKEYDLRELVYAKISFKDIFDISVHFRIFRGNSIYIILEQQAYNRIYEHIPSSLRTLTLRKNSLHRFIFDINVDSKCEILDFIEKAQKLLEKSRKDKTGK